MTFREVFGRAPQLDRFATDSTETNYIEELSAFRI